MIIVNTLFIAMSAMYITWVFYTAVMRLREVRDAGKLKFKRNPVRVSFCLRNAVYRPYIGYTD